MQPKKRKHQKVDLTKQKVQYVVDIKLTSAPSVDITKKAPELVKINYSDNQQQLRPYPHFLPGGQVYTSWTKKKSSNKSKYEEQYEKNSANYILHHEKNTLSSKNTENYQ